MRVCIRKFIPFIYEYLLCFKINAPKDRKMSESLNRYGVLKTEKHIKYEMNLDSVRNKKSDIDRKGRNQIDNFAEQNKKV